MEQINLFNYESSYGQNSNFGFEKDKETQYIKTSKGEELPFKLFSNNDTNTNIPTLRDKAIQYENGDFALVERQFTEYNSLSFTAGTSIANVNDVAWLFRALEDEAVENVFLLYKFKDSSYLVQHLSSGGITGTVVDMRLVVGNVTKMNPESITLIHNHPSGKLVASNEDRNILKKIQDYFDGSGIAVEPGIIINLKSGKYLQFYTDKGIDKVLELEQQHQKQENVKIYSFSKQVFRANYQPFKIKSADYAAAYISSQKFGVSDKTEALILNNNNEVVGKFILPQRKLTEKLAEVLTTYGGTAVILYGNNVTEQMHNTVKNKLQLASFALLDSIRFQSGNYFSLENNNEITNYQRYKPSNMDDNISNSNVGEQNEVYASQEKWKIQIGVYSDIESKNITPTDYTFDSIEEMKGTLEMMMDQYKEDPYLIVREKEGAQSTLLNNDSYYALISFVNEVSRNQNNNNTQMETNPKLQEYIDIQRRQLDEWKEILKPEVFQILEKNILATNTGITDENKIQRGVNIEMELRNNVVKEFKQLNLNDLGIPTKIPVQSHLSDALFEIETGMPELLQQASQRISFVKNLLIGTTDLNKSISDEELNKLWEQTNPSILQQNKEERQTATKKDFLIGAELISKNGDYEFTILKKYDDGVWEARGKGGDKVIFESEAEHYFIKPKEQDSTTEITYLEQNEDVRFSDRYSEEMDVTSTGYQIEDVLEDNFNNLDNKEKYFSTEMFNKENTTKELNNYFVKPENLTDNQKIFINDVLNVASTLEIASTETARYLNDKFFDVYEKEIFSTDDFYSLDNSEKNNDFNKIIESSGFKYDNYGISRNENYTAIEEMAKKSIFVDSFKFLADNYPIINSAAQTHFSVLAEMLEKKDLQKLKNPLVIVNGKEFPLNERNLNEKIKQMQDFLQNRNILSNPNTLKTMSEKEFDTSAYLQNQVKYSGFGETKEIAEAINKGIMGKEDFSIKVTDDKKPMFGNVIDYELKFANNEKGVFFNSFDATLTKKDGSQLVQNFNTKEHFTAKEALNLLEGRSVRVDFDNPKTGKKDFAYVSLNFNEKLANGNFKKMEWYGKNLPQLDKLFEAQKVFFESDEKKAFAIKNIEKGNVVNATFDFDNKKTEGKILFSPQNKKLNLYDSYMKRLDSNDQVKGLEINQTEEKSHARQQGVSR